MLHIIGGFWVAIVLTMFEGFLRAAEAIVTHLCDEGEKWEQEMNEGMQMHGMNNTEPIDVDPNNDCDNAGDIHNNAGLWTLSKLCLGVSICPDLFLGGCQVLS